MQNSYPKPRWWRLYAIVPVALALLVIESQLTLPSLGHKLVEILIVVVTIGLMGLWVLASAAALEWSDVAEAQASDLAGNRRRRAAARPGSAMTARAAPVDTDSVLSLRNR